MKLLKNFLLLLFLLSSVALAAFAFAEESAESAKTSAPQKSGPASESHKKKSPPVLEFDFDNSGLKGYSFRSSYQEGHYFEKLAFHNGLRVGASLQTGNTYLLSVGALERLALKKKRVTNIFLSEFNYLRINRDNGFPFHHTSSRDLYFTDKVLWEFYPRLYLYLGGGWLTSKTIGIQDYRQAYTGLGYGLVDTGKYVLNLEGGYEFDFENQIDPFENESVLHNASIGFDTILNLNKFVYIENVTKSLFGMNHPKNINIISNTNLNVKLNKYFSLSVGFQFHFDNDPVPTFRKLDTRSTCGILFFL